MKTMKLQNKRKLMSLQLYPKMKKLIQKQPLRISQRTLKKPQNLPPKMRQKKL